MSAMHAMYRDLQTFLATCFDDEELRQLAFSAFPDDEIYASLPGAGASRRDLAFELTTLLAKHHPAPPPDLWTYLLQTRPRRHAELSRLRAAFDAPAPTPPAHTPLATPTAPASDPELYSRLPSRRGRCDLLACPHPIQDATADPFALLRPGLVNGLRREFWLEWTAHSLVIHTVPTLYRERQQMPPQLPLPLPLPLDAPSFVYYPLGRAGRDGHDAIAPTLYRFHIERWDRGARRLTLATACGRRWHIELHEMTGG